mgnify:CR=1 FL=1
MKIAVFLQYYHTPDCPTAARPYALVERLAQNHEVTVLTTQAWEQKRLSYNRSWVPDGARLVRFDVPYDNAMSPLERLSAFVRYAVRAGLHGLRMSRPDLIIGSSTPLTAAAAAACVARLRNIPWLFEVRDLWPDFPIQMGAIPNSLLQRLLYGLEQWLYKSAAHVVTLSPDMEQHVRTIAPSTSVSTIPYGTDRDLLPAFSKNERNELRRQFRLNRSRLVLYAGALGRANAIPTLLDTARQFDDRPDVLFGFAGRGYHEDTVRRAAQQHDHIRLIDPLPYPSALTLFGMADLSLVSFIDRPVLTTNAPGKFFDSLSAGTPVVVTNPGWTRRFVDRHECGWYVPPDSPDALASRLRSLLDAPETLSTAGHNARKAARRTFDRSRILDRYADLVSRVAPPAESPSLYPPPAPLPST